MLDDVELRETESGNDLTDWLRRLWPTSVIVGVVLVTIFGGFLLAYQDMPEEHPPLVVVRPTPTPTQALLPTVTPVPLPTSTATQTPLPTVTLVPSPILTPTSPASLTPTSGPAVETPTATSTPQATPTPTLTPTLTPTPTPCGPPASWWLYIVQPGDTLLILATRYGTSTGAIMRANCLSSPTIYPGQRLYLPPVGITPTPTLSPTPSVDITPTSTPVYITSTPTLSPTPCKPPADWQMYVVQRGDTLYSLALRYNTTVYAIVQANCLTSYAIYVGQILYLPPLPATPTPTVTHTPTSTPTATWTPTLIATPTDTATPTIEPTATDTPTTVPSTATSTASPTLTPTPIPPPPTATPSATATP
jgi:LysM repeat protein